MSHLYIDQHGCQLAISQQQLIIRQTDKTELAYPIEQVQRITITSQVHFTAAAIKALFRHNIATVFCSQSGYIQGQLKSAQNKGTQVLRRAQQYRLMDNPEQSLVLARQLIYAKAHNQHRTLHNWSLNKEYNLSVWFKKIKHSSSLEELRAYEGQAAKQYFAAINHKLSATEFDFPARRRHPSPDPVNALLSFGYTLLQSELMQLTDSYGLDNFVGFLHQPNGGQPALVLDLIEPFRPIVDRLVVRLLLQQYQADDFIMTDQGCRLKEGRRAIFLNAWEKHLTTPLQKSRDQVNYRAIFRQQVSEWAHFLDGQIESPRWWLMHVNF